MPIKNYTTEVAEERTVGEIMGLLAAKGARSVRIDYDELNRPTGVGFIVIHDGIPIPFKLPCNFDGVRKAMARDYKSSRARYRFETRDDSKEQVRRVAWRIIRDWVAAQMAIIEAEQASLIQIFLPYVAQKGGVTMYEQFIAHVEKTKMLPAGPLDE